MPAKTRKFNGKTYKFEWAGMEKSQANIRARHIREDGGAARVVKNKKRHSWRVYARR